MPEDPDPADVAALRADLTVAPYTVESLEAAWGAVAAEALGRDDPEPALAALAARPRSAAGVLGAAFVLGARQRPEDLAAALPALGVEGARRLGLVEEADGLLAPRVDLRPYALTDESGVAAWWIVSDPGELALGGELPEDHVLGAGAASSTLARILVPAGDGDVLDLGTGSGVQALIAARTARRVVGTDVSRRALGFARLTAALNGVAVDLRHGSLYEPVAGERFDRVVSNPPFVITPRTAAVPAYTYRDGGFTGDGLVEAVVRGAADHLRTGGIAQLLGNWEVRGDPAAARARVLDWAGALDVWVVERDLLDPAQYAETWVRDGGTQPGSPRWRALVRQWLDDFAARGVTAIGAGWITLRAPAAPGSPLRRFEALDQPLGSGVGTAIATALAVHDRLAATDDAALLAEVLRVAGDVTEHRHYWPGDADPTVIELRQGAGFARTRRVDTVVAAAVGACDGDLALGAILDAVARLLDADPAAVRGAALPVVRELLVDGFLALPASASSAAP